MMKKRYPKSCTLAHFLGDGVVEAQRASGTYLIGLHPTAPKKVVPHGTSSPLGQPPCPQYGPELQKPQPTPNASLCSSLTPSPLGSPGRGHFERRLRGIRRVLATDHQLLADGSPKMDCIKTNPSQTPRLIIVAAMAPFKRPSRPNHPRSRRVYS